jgi:uncharacterized protein YjiS (DUF1127 family)
MLDPIGKTLHRLGMQLPSCSLISREDHRVAATPAVAAVPSPTGTRPFASRREAGARIVRGFFDIVRSLWMRHRERRMPLELDDRVLRDLGLTRAEYRFLLMSRAVTVPDRSQKQQESSRSAAAFL